MELVEREPRPVVLVNRVFAKGADPFVVDLEAHFGPALAIEAPPYVLYMRDRPPVGVANP